MVETKTNGGAVSNDRRAVAQVVGDMVGQGGWDGWGGWVGSTCYASAM